MKRHFKIILSTCIVGLGVSFGLFVVTTIHGLLGDAHETLFNVLSIVSRIAGAIAAGAWAVRRYRKQAVNTMECLTFLLALFAFSYFLYLNVSTEVNRFLAFHPLDAANRLAVRHYGEQTKDVTYLGTTLMGVRVYSVKLSSGEEAVVGVSPRFKLWWAVSFNMPRVAFDADAYDRLSTIESQETVNGVSVQNSDKLSTASSHA